MCEPIFVSAFISSIDKDLILLSPKMILKEIKKQLAAKIENDRLEQVISTDFRDSFLLYSNELFE